MNIAGVQVVSALFAFFMMYVTFLHWKRKDLNGIETFVWLFLWVGFIYIDFNPYVLQGLADDLYFFRVMDLLMVISFMILAFLGFKNYFSNKRMERRIEELIREESLTDINKERNFSNKPNTRSNKNVSPKSLKGSDKSN